MRENQKTQIGLPAPRWCFVLLGVPTFYMPLAYLAVGVWAIAGVLAGDIGDMPELMMDAVFPGFCVTFVMWPIYIAWAGLSKRLARREKVGWILIVLILNMVGMPVFYVFMVRRYLGLEGRTGKRDEIALDRFLKHHAISRDRLSPDQLNVLRSYCRNCRLAKWGVAPTIAVAALILYMVVVIVPKRCVPLFAEFTPTRVVITDAATGSKQEIAPEPETLKLHVEIVMMLGAGAGVMAAWSVFLLALVLSQFWGNSHRKALIEFLQASESEHLTDPST